jgi:hypothetical protein
VVCIQQRGEVAFKDDARKAGRHKAQRAYEAVRRAKHELWDTMNTEDGYPLVPRLGVMADELDRLCEDLCDQYGILVQVLYNSDAAEQELLAQRAFLDMRESIPWSAKIIEHDGRQGKWFNLYEVVTEDDPKFFVRMES